MSANWAVFVFLGSTTTKVLSWVPSFLKYPRTKSLYLPKCLGCAWTGLLPQNITKSALFLYSPKVEVGAPTSWIANNDGPWHTEAVLSKIAPNISPNSTPLPWASHSVLENP